MLRNKHGSVEISLASIGLADESGLARMRKESLDELLKVQGILLVHPDVKRVLPLSPEDEREIIAEMARSEADSRSEQARPVPTR